MAEDKVRHDDIIEPDLFANTEKSAEELITVLDRLEQTFVKTGQSAAKAFGSPSTVAQMKAEVEAIKAIDKAETQLTEVNKQRVVVAEQLSAIRVKEQQQKAALKVATDNELRQQREATKQAKQQQDAYQKLSTRHRELVKEAKALAVAYGTESKAAKTAAQEANKLDQQLKKIDASVGQHQRNVGNYSSALKGMGQSFLGAFGITLGAGAVIQGLKSSVVAFVEAEKNAHALGFALKNVAGEGTAAFDKLIAQSEELQARGGIFSDDDIQKSQTQLVNFGLLSDEITPLMPKILDLAATLKVDLGTATDIVIKGLNGQTKGLKQVGLDFKDTGNVIDNYNVLLGKLDKFQGAAIASTETMEGKYAVLMNRFDDFQEDIGEFLIDTGFGFLEWWDKATGKVSDFEAALKSLNAFNESVRDKELALMRSQYIDPTKTKVEQLQELAATLRLIKADVAAENTIYESLPYGADRDASLLRLQKLNNELTNLARIQDEINNPDKYSGKPRTFNTDKDGGGVTKVASSEFDAAQAEFDNLMFQIKTANEAADQSEKDRIARNKRNQEMYKSEREREYALYMYKKALREKERQEELEKMRKDIDLAEKLSDATFKGLDERFDIQQQELEDNGDDIDAELQRQSDRQLAGLDNTYSEQVRLKAENDAKLAEIEEKRRKAENAKELADLFIDFTKAYAKNGDINAAQKALAQAVAVKAIADTIAGSFYEGTEDTGKVNQPLDSKGGRIAILHNNERVMPERLNKLLGGISNDELAQRALMFDNLYAPQLSAALAPEDSRTYKRGESDWMGSAVLNQLAEATEEIKKLPKETWGYDNTEKAFYHLKKRDGLTKKIYKRF